MRIKSILIFLGVVIGINIKLNLPSFAQGGTPNISCSISATTLNFGNYDVFSFTALTTSSTLQINCTTQGNSTVNLLTTSLGKGNNSSTFSPRQMSNNSQLLNYDIYTDSNQTTIWGDGTSGTSTITNSKVVSVNLPIYGTIPARQDVTVGTYQDNVSITVNF